MDRMDAYLTQAPAARAGMLIRKPVREVFEAIVDPEVTRNFWFTRGSGRLEPGKEVVWEWEMYGASARARVLEVDPDRRILVEWGDPAPTRIEWVFSQKSDRATYVSVTCTGYSGSGDEIVSQAIDTTEGFTIVLCGLKAYLEHGIRLNLVADHSPDSVGKK